MMSNIGKGLIKMRFYSLAGYMFLRKLEGKDNDDTYEEELIGIILDLLGHHSLPHEKSEDLQLFMKVVADELIEGHYEKIEDHLGSVDRFAILVQYNFELKGFGFEDLIKIIKPLYNYIYERISKEEK